MSAWGFLGPTVQVCVHLALPACQFSLFPQLWLLFLLPSMRQFLLHKHITLHIPKQELKSSPMCISQLSQFSRGTAEAELPVQPRVPAGQCWHLSLEIGVAPCCCPDISSSACRSSVPLLA